MQTITLSDQTANDLRQGASLRGVDADAYAEELLARILTAQRNTSADVGRPGPAGSEDVLKPLPRFDGATPSGWKEALYGG